MIIWMDYSPNNLPHSAGTSGQWKEVVIDAQGWQWEGAWGKQEKPMSVTQESVWRVWVWFRKEEELKYVEALEAQATRVNNMYKIEAGNRDWICPFCEKVGTDMGCYFGKCQTAECGGVRTAGTVQDVSTIGKGKRKVDSIFLQGKKGMAELRTFFTDASGQVINEASGLLETGWAIVEVELVQDKLQQIAVRGKKMKGQPSVQRCEAMAILEVVQSVPQGSQVHIHTDSKVTVQAIRSMCTKIYKKKRKIKNSNFIGQIVQTIRQKDISAMI